MSNPQTSPDRRAQTGEDQDRPSRGEHFDEKQPQADPRHTQHAIDDMLRIIESVRHGNHRDPLRALEDTLLEMRHAIPAEE